MANFLGKDNIFPPLPLRNKTGSIMGYKTIHIVLDLGSNDLSNHFVDDITQTYQFILSDRERGVHFQY